MTSRLAFVVAVLLAALWLVPPMVRAQDSSRKTDHWAFQPVRRPAVPEVANLSWAKTPIDAFVLAALEKKGIRPAPAADRRTLLRRVYLDLIGLPPTPQEQRAFLADPSPEAYARVVDRLLASPRYGERWARHWLDVARYAESNGYERDGAKPSAWRYRDYVIDAFNRDKPYDRFVQEQIAGDELDNSDAAAQIATTFLRLGTWDDEPADPAVDRYDQLDDVLGTTATAFLGLTLRCARCHDHKFEPFTQKDYYQMLAVFEPLKRPQNDRTDLDRIVGTEAERKKYHAALDDVERAAAGAQKQLDALRGRVRDRVFAAALANRQPTALPADAVRAFQLDPARRTTVQKGLVQQFAGRLDAEITANLTTAEKAQRKLLEVQIATARAFHPKGVPFAYIWYEDGPRAPVTHVLRRGDPTRPAGEVGPGLPAVLVATAIPPPRPTAHSTGRRLWLARWLTRRDNPLTARVMVNRVWQHHFGQGLVASANEFGTMGDRPSHPELLDWLSAEFVASGWRLKALHRTIVLSNTYQMTSAVGPEIAERDPKGSLLSHWRQRRLEAEAVRDAVLAVSGRLNTQMTGPGIYPAIPQAVLEGQSRPGDGWVKSDERQAARRSIYIFVKRSLAVPELDVLDAPDTTSSCEQRPVSTTAPQALTFLNGDFIQQQAHALAARLRREAGDDAAAQVRDAFVLALCRPPHPEESQAALDFLARQQRQVGRDTAGVKAAECRRRALEAFCLVLLNTNEFAYVD
jgi:hypothetical protein